MGGFRDGVGIRRGCLIIFLIVVASPEPALMSYFLIFTQRKQTKGLVGLKPFTCYKPQLFSYSDNKKTVSAPPLW